MIKRFMCLIKGHYYMFEKHYREVPIEGTYYRERVCVLVARCVHCGKREPIIESRHREEAPSNGGEHRGKEH